MLNDLLISIRRRYHPLHWLRKSKLFRKILPWIDRPIAWNLGFRRRVWIRPVTHASFIFASEDLEPGVRRCLIAALNCISRGARFFDVGANIGWYSWLAADVRDDIQIIAFEPDPTNLELLCRSAARRKNVIVEGVALSDRNGSAPFHCDPLSGATGSLEPEDRAFISRHYGVTGKTIEIPVTTLDHAAKRYGIPALIKIDVEGHERCVLDGGWETITKARPIIVVESFENRNFIREKFGSLDYVIRDADRLEAASSKTTNFLLVPYEQKGFFEKHLQANP